MRSVLKVLSLAAAVASLAGSAAADVLVLANGTRERGVIVKETPDGYWLETGPRMKVLYERAEVAAIERESEQVNAALRAKWGRRADARAAGAGEPPRQARENEGGREPARPETPMAAGEATEDGVVDDAGGVVPKAKRYEFLQGGGFKPGVTTQSEVLGRLGGPDDKGTTVDGAPVFYYDVGGGDIYALSFGRVEGKRQPVLIAMWFVSNVEAEHEREATERQFQEAHGW